MSNEKILERKLRESVKQLGGLAIKIWAVSFTGLPDRLILMPGGKISFVELKSERKKPSPRQEAVIGMLRKLGFAVFVIDSKILLDEFLNELKYGK